VSDEPAPPAAAVDAPSFSSPGQPPPVAAQEASASGVAQAAASRPEVLVGGAFAAGFLFAKLLRSRGR
jgi:hypothetical protein